MPLKHLSISRTKRPESLILRHLKNIVRNDWWYHYFAETIDLRLFFHSGWSS